MIKEKRIQGHSCKVKGDRLKLSHSFLYRSQFKKKIRGYANLWIPWISPNNKVRRECIHKSRCMYEEYLVKISLTSVISHLDSCFPRAIHIMLTEISLSKNLTI